MNPWPVVHFDSQQRGWWTPMLCEQCGGYRHDLPVNADADENAALAGAQAVLDSHEQAGCLACRSERCRAAAHATSEPARVWWDARTREWMAWLPAPGVPAGVTLPLGVHRPGSETEAQLAARVLMGDTNPLALRILEPGRPGPVDVACLHQVPGEFKLWLPCFECAGTYLRLAAGDLLGATVEALDCLAGVQADGCPRCLTLAARAQEFSDTALKVWYDTLMHDWMMRVPGINGDASVALLGIGRFAASNQEVAAACDAHVTQLHGRGGEERR